MGLMSLSSDDYLNQLQALLPQGPAWPREEEAGLTQTLRSWADEMARFDSRLIDLVNEADPRSTAELLLDWEREAGLPDGCLVGSGESQTTGQRRSALVARLTMQGGQSRRYFIELAAAMGYTVTISVFRPYTVRSPVNAPICGSEWTSVWTVNSSLNTVKKFNVRSGVNDPLAAWGNAALECVINRFKPAHTLALFVYS